MQKRSFYIVEIKKLKFNGLILSFPPSIKFGELFTLLDNGFKWGFTVYNISAASGTWLTAAGHVVVNRGEDVRLPSGR